jgi:hypothetical protein
MDGIASAVLNAVFDAERDTPELIDEVVGVAPQVREVMTQLRESLPLVSNAGVGPLGGFYRLPNHYRSVSFMLEAGSGVVVFKGTEPLLPDFPAYFDWMLNAPFRASALPLGLHFPLDMKLPPAAMWIEESRAEQAVASKLQQQYLARHGQLARLPVPLFVFKMTPAQIGRYEEVVRPRISAEAFWKFKNKLADGLGVEVYYYPELPVRVADLFVGNVRETFKAALAPEQIEATCGSWIRLLAEMLCLDYMPYVPWHHGMGGCVDPGNVCIDGGFNDLLTLTTFDAIPDEVLFRRSMQATIQMLAESMTSLSAASIGLPAVTETDATALTASYITEGLREHILASERDGHAMDARLGRFFAPPKVADIAHLLHATHRNKGKPAQYVARLEASAPAERPMLKAVAGA